ncbi:MAG: hypothetical protein DBY36_07825 [Clostridiales bacterium]|nr:MAG: hypothetical protein DBY36_07825 [Clostridiales bacterium]
MKNAAEKLLLFSGVFFVNADTGREAFAFRRERGRIPPPVLPRRLALKPAIPPRGASGMAFYSGYAGSLQKIYLTF